MPAHSDVQGDARDSSQPVDDDHLYPVISAIRGRHQSSVVTRREDVWSEVDLGAGFDEERALLRSGTATNTRYATSKGVCAEFEHDADGDSKRALLRSRQGVGSMGVFWRLVIGNQAGDKNFPGPHFTMPSGLRPAFGWRVCDCYPLQVLPSGTPVEVTDHYSHAT